VQLDVPEGHPDSYIKDWWSSILFKKAMKGEAIKRGEHYDSEFEVNEDDEKVAMTIITREEGFDNAEDSEQEANAQDIDGVEHNLGFLKKISVKGNIKMLSENEIGYLKSVLKQDNSRWEEKTTLHDLFRHCKFTIRMLTRQMANVDNRSIFKGNSKPNKAGTLLMVYRAERLYAALSDGQKLFKLIA
jgi:hypothetical protein